MSMQLTSLLFSSNLFVFSDKNPLKQRPYKRLNKKQLRKERKRKVEANKL